MKKWLGVMAVLCLLSPLFPSVMKAEESIQSIIDEAEPGSTVYIESGTYHENIVLNKPLTLIGKGNVIIESTSNSPVISIEHTSDITVENIQLSCRDKDSVGIQANASEYLVMRNVKLSHFNSGIELFNIGNSEISDVTIEGKKGHFSKKSNGVTLYKTNKVKVTGAQIRNVQDGIYVEEDHQSQLIGNLVSHSRYGIHLMYSDGTALVENQLSQNVTGLMHMMSDGTSIKRNTVEHQTGYNGSGMVLYNGKDIEVEENTVAHNGVGMTLQNVAHSAINGNRISSNQTGLQFIQYAQTNEFAGNEVYGNIMSVSSDRIGAVLERNYWDEYSGMDVDGDGLGDTFYQSNDSFGRLMVKQKAYQYFFESPAVVTLGKMEKKLSLKDKNAVRDEKPLLQGSGSNVEWGMNVFQLILGSAGFAGGWFVWRKLSGSNG